MDTLNLSAETTTLPLPTALRRAADRDATVVESDPNGIIIHVNDKFCKTFGYSREEMLGQELFVLSSTCHPQDFLDELWVSIAQGNAWNGEISSRIKDGNLLWQDVSITPIAEVGRSGWKTRKISGGGVWYFHAQAGRRNPLAQVQVINQLSIAMGSASARRSLTAGVASVRKLH